MYRSSYELIAFDIFEQQKDVVRYDYEPFSIPYICVNGLERRTVPDFLVYYKDGTKEIIEVKPFYKIERNIGNTNEKISATEHFCKEKGMKFSVMSEKQLNLK